MGKRLLETWFAIGLAVAATASATQALAQDSPIRVGIILTLSGPPAFAGLREKDGIELALAKINSSGGVRGRKIEVAIQDDAADPNAAVSAFNFLAGQEDIVAVVGSTIGSSTMAFAPLAKRERMPVLAPNSTYQITRLGNDYIFRVALPSDVEVDAAAQEFVRRGYKRIGLLYTNDAYGKQGAELLGQRKELSIVASEQVDAKATDYSPQLIKIRGAKPDALIIWGGSPYPGIGIKNASQLGFDIPVYAPSAAATEATLKAAAGARLLSKARLQGQYDFEKPEPRQQEFLKLYHDKFKADPDSFAATGWDAMMVLAKGLELADSPLSRESLRNGLEKVKRFEGFQGIYSYSRESRDGTNVDSVIWLGVTDGKFVKAKE
jgi:branched-chain amino acid transport system substrate-binding protein